MGQSFAQKIGNQLEQANLYLSGAGKVELAEHTAQTELPDNEPLLLHPLIGKDGISNSQDILSIKKGRDLMMSLGDFCTVTGFAIKTKAADGTASGWYYTNDRTFNLDVKANKVTLDGKAQDIPAGGAIVSGADIMVRSDLLEKWFGVNFTYAFADLSVGINTVKAKQLLPMDAAYQRGLQGGAQTQNDGVPRLPFLDQSYGLLSRPYIDTNLSANIFDPHTGSTGEEREFFDYHERGYRRPERADIFERH